MQPNEADIIRVMCQLGVDRMVAVRHLQDRAVLLQQRRKAHEAAVHDQIEESRLASWALVQAQTAIAKAAAH